MTLECDDNVYSKCGRQGDMCFRAPMGVHREQEEEEPLCPCTHTHTIGEAPQPSLEQGKNRKTTWQDPQYVPKKT